MTQSLSSNSSTSTSSSSPATVHEYKCVLCPEIYSNAHDLRDHYLNPNMHSPVLIRRNRASLAATPHAPLIVCPTCTDLNISLGQQGYSLHRRHRHVPHPSAPPSSNSIIIKDLFHPTTDLDPWQNTLLWLYQNSDLAQPPPYRKSLYSKIPFKIRERIQDHALLTLRALQLSTQRSADAQTLTPAFEYSPLPLLRLFVIFETVLLAPPGDSGQRHYRRLIPCRLQRFRDGHFRELYTQVYSMPPRPQTSYDPALDPMRINRNVEAAVRNGDLHSALQQLDPQPRAPFTDQNLRIILKLHPPPVHTSPPKLAPPPDDLSAFHLDQLEHTLRRSPRGKAPGYLADSPDLLLDIYRRDVPGCVGLTGLDLIKDLYKNLLSGAYPEEIWPMLNPNYLAAKYKDFANRPEKLRPLNMGTAIRRSLSRHVIKAHAPDLAEFFINHQFAIGVSGGIDFIIHTVMQIISTRMNPRLETTARFALLILDFRNMFNEISRVKAREELEIHFPHLLYLFDRLYPLSGNLNYYLKPDGTWGSFLQKEGFAQGCPLGPFLSALVLLRLLTDLQAELDARASDLHNKSFTVAYIDDSTSPSRLPDIAFIFRYLSEHGPDYGLHLSTDKNHILLSVDGTFPFHELPPSLLAEIKWAADTFCKGHIDLKGVTLLGNAIGDPDFVSQSLAAYADAFSHTTHILCDRITSPATRLKLFTACIQERVQFRHFADAALPTTTLTIPEGGYSPFIRSIFNTAYQFLSSLADTAHLPPHSWAIATLPLRQGGLAFHDPTAQALPSFLRPILRTIRCAKLGVPVRDFAVLARDPLVLESEAITWVPLPAHIRSLFSDWQSSSTPFLQRFNQLIIPYLQFADPQCDCQLLLDPHAKPLTTIKRAHQQWLLKRYNSKRSSFPQSFLQAESSLRSPLISKALTQLPLKYAAYRTTPFLFVLALKRKLRLPLFPRPQKCTLCAKTCDIWGDHAFYCFNNSKTILHHRVRDSFFLIFTHLCTHAQLTSTDTSIALEPSGLLPQYPTLRPGDVVIRTNPGILKVHATHLLFDITSIKMPSSTSPVSLDDPQPSIVIREHEEAENGKFVGHYNRYSPGVITQAILQQPYVLIPITFDPGGQFGPLTTSFLWGTPPPDMTLLPPPKAPDQRCEANLSSSPFPRQAAQLACQATHNFGLFHLADKGWKQSHLHEWFTDSYTAMIPSQWAQQILAQNLLVATTNHLKSGLDKAFPLTSNHSTPYLHVAGQHPRHVRPTFPLPSEYFYRLTAVRPTDK